MNHQQPPTQADSLPTRRPAAASGSEAPGRALGAGRMLFYLAVALTVVYAAAYWSVMWRSDAGIDGPAGITMAMALDLVKGVFYRPLLGPLGYGGTRYFPLYFLLHAALLKLGVPVLVGAYFLSLASMLLLLVCLFRLLRALGVEAGLATACSLAILASFCAQYVTISPHAEPLATAFDLLGLAALVRRKDQARGIACAALLFTLAWSAKFTTCFGVTAGVLWLMSTGRRARALQLAAATLTGYAAVAALMILGSRGRVIEIFQVCALGGTNWHRFLSGPLLMTWNAVAFDRNVLLLIFFSLGVLLADLLQPGWKFFQHLPGLLILVTAVGTMGIFGSPGTNANHLLDMQVAAIVLLGSMTTRSNQVPRTVAIYSLGIATLVPISLNAHQLLRHNGLAARNNLMAVEETLQANVSPDAMILSENPAIPVVAGKQPYVLDSFMLAIARRKIPGFGSELLQKIQQKQFGAVVLQFNPESEDGREWYERRDFGPGFTDAISRNYRLLGTSGDQYIYVPADHAAPHPLSN